MNSTTIHQSTTGSAGQVFSPDYPLEDLVDKIAESQANALMGNGRDEVKTTQLRKYFHEIKEIYHQIRDNENPEEMFKKQLYRIKLLRSKVEYDAGRDTNRIPQSLKKFIENASVKCDKWNKFEKFVLHFEAVLGFFYGFQNSRKNYR